MSLVEDIAKVNKAITEMTEADRTAWLQRLAENDKAVKETLQKLAESSRVDPRLLDEPATI